MDLQHVRRQQRIAGLGAGASPPLWCGDADGGEAGTLAEGGAMAGFDSLFLPLRQIAPGRYELTSDALVIAGIWQLRLIVLPNDFEQVTFDFALPMR